jgi:hypothetical protein
MTDVFQNFIIDSVSRISPLAKLVNLACHIETTERSLLVTDVDCTM